MTKMHMVRTIAVAATCLATGACATSSEEKVATSRAKMDDVVDCPDDQIDENGDCTEDPGGGGGGGDPGDGGTPPDPGDGGTPPDPGDGGTPPDPDGGTPPDPGLTCGECDSADPVDPSPPTLCQDGLYLQKQVSNGELVQFTTQGQYDLAHCIESYYLGALGSGGTGLTVASGTRDAYQQAYVMYRYVYQGGGCAALTAQYGANHAADVAQMCAIAAAGGGFDAIVNQWWTFTSAAEASGNLFSAHERGASVDFSQTGVDSATFMWAMGQCGGTLNPEPGHFHVTMSGSASSAPYQGGACGP